MPDKITLDLTRPHLLYQRPLAGPKPTPGEGHGNEQRYGDWYSKRAAPIGVAAIYHFEDGKTPEVGVVFRDGTPSPQGFTEEEFLRVYLAEPRNADGSQFFTSLAQLATAYKPAYINWVVSRGP
jgi:hypothetical protein